MDKIMVWIKNASIFHHQIMRKFLEKRGWVVFYLDEASRTCGGDICWLKLYQEERKRSNKGGKNS